MPSYTLEHIANHLGAQLQGDGQLNVDNLAPLDQANSQSISFLSRAKYRSALADTKACAFILKSDDASLCTANKIIMADPYLGFAKVGQLFQMLPQVRPGVHPTAVIGNHCQIAKTAAIGPNVVIGDQVSIGEHTQIHANSSIGDGSSIGDHCTIWSQVSIYYRVSIGNCVSIHSGTVIGADGFGLANDQGRWEKIPQLGSVIIEDDVEIGANSAVDRGALENTIIHRGVKIDNHVQIAHNVEIGEHSAIAALTAIAGSVKIGKHCIFAGKVAVSGHIEVTDNVILTACTTISVSIEKPGVYSSGNLPAPNRVWRKNAVRFLKLDEFVKRLKKLEKKMEETL